MEKVKALRQQRLQNLGVLSSAIAHDIDNILTSIATYIALAKGEERLEKRKGYFQKVENALFRASQLSRHVVNYAKGYPNEGEGHDALSSLKEISEWALESIRKRKKGVKIKLKLSEEKGYLLALSSSELSQIFLNLFFNACEAIEIHGEVSVEGLFVKREGKVFFCLEIKDNGKGIEPHHRNEIFTPFFTTKGEEGGSGLGLSIVKDLVDKAKGKLEVYSQPGIGTVFTVLLPSK